MFGAEKLFDGYEECSEVNRVFVPSEVVDLRFDLEGEVFVDGHGAGAVSNL